MAIFNVIPCYSMHHSISFNVIFFYVSEENASFQSISSNQIQPFGFSKFIPSTELLLRPSIGIDRHRSASKASKVPGLQKLGQPSDELRHFQDLPCHSQHFTDAIHLRCQDKMEEFSNLGNSWFVGEKTDGHFFWVLSLGWSSTFWGRSTNWNGFRRCGQLDVQLMVEALLAPCHAIANEGHWGGFQHVFILDSLGFLARTSKISPMVNRTWPASFSRQHDNVHSKRTNLDVLFNVDSSEDARTNIDHVGKHDI